MAADYVDLVQNGFCIHLVAPLDASLQLRPLCLGFTSIRTTDSEDETPIR